MEALQAYECRRPSGALRFRCRECCKDLSITSGTLFVVHMLRKATAEDLRGRVVGREGKTAAVDGG